MTTQRTIDRRVAFRGIGLHSGRPCTATFAPEVENAGISFVRTDLKEQSRIAVGPEAARYDPARGRRTILSNGKAEVHTVEHILASIHGLGIDNVRVELDSEEAPEPVDGSALPIVKVLKSAGLREQSALRRYLKLAEPVTLEDGPVQLLALPHDGLRITFTIDYPDQVVGTQSASFELDPDTFEREIAPARTFVMMRDVQALQAAGLIKGGSLSNAVVVEDEKVLSEEPLRFPNEFVRHKILDLLGDLCLVGGPIRAHVVAFRSGHQSHVKFVRKIQQATLGSAGGARPTVGDMGQHTWEISAIERILPHRYPMLLVDRILELTEERVVGIKNVTANEPFFAGHFPGHPIMPAVLIIEAMAQVGGFMLLNRVADPGSKLVYFIGIDQAKFRRPVIPGDQLRFELALVKLKGRICKMRGEAYVGDHLVAEAELLSSLIDR
ncbi:MAG TPA: bifunctional UDP-3-O-[3-hydroxymyristoyl] N-acetylglucosamine deacetylase/3-hydroxyacyl-ACP dehydratase [Candidatus Udaeobacter sp.]|nr:bifunctional UDP-3-O-[3-hydroxymyristoyl] N-acetylglucosamine deacetylase/3-hydroxyacyl-ACP dehydratase [Candidatus Udaeobacter sp.]